MQRSNVGFSSKNNHCIYYSHDFKANQDRHTFQTFHRHLEMLHPQESKEYLGHIDNIVSNENHVFLTYPAGAQTVSIYADSIPSKGKLTFSMTTALLESALYKVLNAAAFLKPEDNLVSLILPHNIGFQEKNVFTASFFVSEFNREKIKIGKYFVDMKMATRQSENEAVFATASEADSDSARITILCYIDFPLPLLTGNKLFSWQLDRQNADLLSLGAVESQEPIFSSEEFLSGQHLLSTRLQLQPSSPEGLRVHETPEFHMNHSSPSSYLSQYRSASATPISARGSANLVGPAAFNPKKLHPKGGSESSFTSNYLWHPLTESQASVEDGLTDALSIQALTLQETMKSDLDALDNLDLDLHGHKPSLFTDQLPSTESLPAITVIKISNPSPSKIVVSQPSIQGSVQSSINSSPIGPNQLSSYPSELELLSATSRSSFYSTGSSPERRAIEASAKSSPHSGASNKSPLRSLTILVPTDRATPKVRSLQFLQKASPK